MKKLLISLLVFTLGLYVAGFVLPAEWRVERSQVIKADRALIHSYVADLHTWPAWTAWTAERDPSTTWTYSGEPVGKGAAYSWEGDEIGNGHLMITAAALSEGIDFELSFDGDSNLSYGSIQYTDAPDGVRVTWSLWGTMSGSPGRWAGLLMDRLAGRDLEAGLEGLDKVCRGGLPGRIEQGAGDLLDEVLKTD
jgi:hypothetical protein